MTLQEAINLPDDTAIQEISFNVNSVNDPKLKSQQNPAWGKEWFAQAFDATGKVGVLFQLKKDKYDPKSLVGKHVKFVGWTNADGKLMGIKLKHKDQYRNIVITDSAKMSIVGESSQAPATSPTASQPTTSNSVNRATFPQQLQTPEEIFKHFATEWCQVYDWTKEIFETRVPAEHVKKCVMNVMIRYERGHGLPPILPVADRKMDWKSYVVQGTKLGDLPPEKLRNGYIATLQGKFKNPDTAAAFTAAFKESGDDHRSVYGTALLREGIEDDTADTILLRRFASTEDMSDDDYKTIIADVKFFEEGKSLQASKKTAFDDDDTITL